MGERIRHEGLVVTRFGASLEVEDSAGRPHRCTSRKKLGDLVCGDRVLWQHSPGGGCVVVERQHRRTLLARPDAKGRMKPMAANLDQIVVVAAPIPELDEQLIDRYLVAAETIGITPVIFLNKVDRLTPNQRQSLEQRLAVYAQVNYEVFYGSAKREHGLDSLRQHLHAHTSILVGQSGVGKSSLVSQLLPAIDIRIGDISETTGFGKHTTTSTRLYHLPRGGELIDSPGVREFSLWHVTPEQAARGFVEFRAYLGSCRFNDCTHRSEPGCAVRRAVKSGAIARCRLESYHRILASLSDAPK